MKKIPFKRAILNNLVRKTINLRLHTHFYIHSGDPWQRGGGQGHVPIKVCPPPTLKLSYAPERWIHGAHYLRQNEQLYGEKKREGKGNKLFKHFFCSSNFIKEWSLCHKL